MGYRDWIHSARKSWGGGVLLWVPLTLLLLIGVYVAWRVLEPAPPKKITIAAGVAGGSYDHFAREYAKHFREDGFELEVRNTAGSVENYELLKDEKSGVDVALVQGGTKPDWATEKLQAVCS